MSRRMIGIILLLGGSEILGILGGEYFFRLFLKTVPPIGLSAFNISTAHGAFIVYGLVAGLAIFAWALIAALISPLFAGKRLGSGATL